jgi:hypothetical protein
LHQAHLAYRRTGLDICNIRTTAVCASILPLSAWAHRALSQKIIVWESRIANRQMTGAAQER